jgi:hypothetical protein
MPRETTIAVAFLGTAAVIWLVLLRPVPVRTATGVIRAKTFRSAGEYVQYQPGVREGFRTPTTIKLAEHYLLQIEVPGDSNDFRYAVNTAAAPGFNVGDTVTFDYQTRGVPPLWRRTYVLDAKRTN